LTLETLPVATAGEDAADAIPTAPQAVATTATTTPSVRFINTTSYPRYTAAVSEVAVGG
jgi:hypothetical protein